MLNLNHNIIRYFILSICLCFFNTAQGVQIVRLNIDYGDPPVPHTLDLELFDDVTPLTTANFLSYVNSGKYDGSFFTRSIQGFITQAGGYTFRPVDPAVNFLHPDDTPPVNIPLEATSPVKNEYDQTVVTNVFGTIAMAKVSHDPDSATTEWFINVADNRENLDNQNGGFTVFGQVIDDGMIIANEISTSIINQVAGTVLGSAFSNLPVAGWIFGTPVYQKNLIMISSATTITRPILRFTPDSETFPLDVTGDVAGSLQTITFTNTGNEALTIDAIATPVQTELTIESDTCTGVTLNPTSVTPAAACTIGVRFIANTVSVITDVLNINYSSNTSNYTAPLILTAEGTTTTAILDVNKTRLAFKPTDQTASTSKALVVKNKGGTNLTINAIISDNSDFTVDTTGCTTNTILSLDQLCNLTVTFSPTSISSTISITGNLTISSSAGDVIVPLAGFGVDPVIAAPASVNFGTTSVDQPIFLPIGINNNGDTGLILTTFTFTGPDADLFSFVTNCPDQAMAAGLSCVVQVTFTPTATGDKSATLVINSNDANNPQIAISLTATATGTTLDTDNDGVLNSIEQLAFNSGDGNNDNISDDTQNAVASFSMGANKQVTLVSNTVTLVLNTGEKIIEKSSLSSVTVLNTLPAEFPRDTLFELGGNSFTVLLTQASTGATIDVGMFLPLNVNTDKFYRFGPTPDNPVPHLYDFTYDANTGLGARMLGAVTVKSNSGDTITRNMIIIAYVDGGLGDDDLTPNGRIVNSIGGFSTIPPSASASSSGAISIYYLLILPLLLMLSRTKEKTHVQTTISY